MEPKNEWERLVLENNVLEEIIKIVLGNRDFYGIYNLNAIENAIRELLNNAIIKEEFEIASDIIDSSILENIKVDNDI